MTPLKSTLECVQPVAAEDHRPDFSVCVATVGGWIYLAEFRTYLEAVALAEAAVERSRLITEIRRCGETCAVLRPVCSEEQIVLSTSTVRVEHADDLARAAAAVAAELASPVV